MPGNSASTANGPWSEKEVLSRVRSIKQWRRGGVRAPHKPIMLLYVLGKLQQTGTSQVSFVSAESDLNQLLQDFGPPRKKTSPAYPFHHLTTDGLWRVSTAHGSGSPGPSLRALRDGASGELEPSLVIALEQHPILFASVTRQLLDSNFPPSMHSDILDAVGLDIDQLEAGTKAMTSKARKRRQAFREEVLRAYEYSCAMCGFDGLLMPEGSVGVDAAHIRWWAAGGPDEVSNAIALCSMHHKLLDRGVIGLTVDHHLTISQHFIGRSRTASQLVVSLSGQPLRSTLTGHQAPAPHHLNWHSSQVFRHPAR